jgi:hypothetical protein
MYIQKHKKTATAINFSYAYNMRYLILFAIITICGCTTYPTVDLRTTDRSSMSSVTERELASIFKLIGFTYNSEAENPYWSYHNFKNVENKILLFYKLEKETLDIRIISHDGESELTQALGKQLEHLLKKQYPLLRYKYKYFEQSHPFG